MDDKEILTTIDKLVREEHEMRERVRTGELSSDVEHARLGEVETALDLCWDLLRQRRARREFGEDPDAAAPRPAPEVEGYLQ